MKTIIKRGTVKQIAKTVGVTHSAVSQWLSGKTTPNLKAAVIIEEKFNIPMKAWLDIKSYLNNTNKTKGKSNTKEGEKVS